MTRYPKQGPWASMTPPVTFKVVPIDSLHEDPANARAHGAENRRVVRASLKEFGQVEALVVTPTGRVIGGNCRLGELKAMGVLEVQVAEVALGGVDAARLGLVLNRSAELATWDEDGLEALLKELDADDLAEDLGWDDGEVEAILGLDPGPVSGDGGGDENGLYTENIKAPVYEPRGAKPPIKDLFKTEKTDALLKQIGETELPEEVEGFLRHAAQRHTVFHFRNIAEFYCRASPEVQDLMERSGLVIIDFDKAIENGFVKMTGKLGVLSDIEGDV